MAAEHVFYGQNTTGVGGDVGSATAQAAEMVGFHAMAPSRVDLSDRIEDPMHVRSGGVDPGRDGCRVPFPWSGTEPR